MTEGAVMQALTRRVEIVESRLNKSDTHLSRLQHWQDRTDGWLNRSASYIEGSEQREVEMLKNHHSMANILESLRESLEKLEKRDNQNVDGTVVSSDERPGKTPG